MPEPGEEAKFQSYDSRHKLAEADPKPDMVTVSCGTTLYDLTDKEGTVKAFGALDTNLGCTKSRNLCAHRPKAAAEIHDFRLARGIDQQALAFCQARGHQEIFGGSDRDRRKGDLGAAQSLGRACVDVAFAQLDLGAQMLQAPDVEVHGPGPDRATSRQRHPRTAAARNQWPQYEY